MGVDRNCPKVMLAVGVIGLVELVGQADRLKHRGDAIWAGCHDPLGDKDAAPDMVAAELVVERADDLFGKAATVSVAGDQTALSNLARETEEAEGLVDEEDLARVTDAPPFPMHIRPGQIGDVFDVLLQNAFTRLGASGAVEAVAYE